MRDEFLFHRYDYKVSKYFKRKLIILEAYVLKRKLYFNFYELEVGGLGSYEFKLLICVNSSNGCDMLTILS